METHLLWRYFPIVVHCATITFESFPQAPKHISKLMLIFKKQVSSISLEQVQDIKYPIATIYGIIILKTPGKNKLIWVWLEVIVFRAFYFGFYF